MTDLKKLKQLREQTGTSIALCNKALSESKGNLQAAAKLLAKWGVEIADKKKDRVTKSGIIQSYVHHNFRMAAMVSLLCETDFVAKNEALIKLGRELAMQVASMNPKSTTELLKQAYIRDQSLTIEDLVKKHIALLGENIQIGEFVRLSL